ncbi:MAG TPA: PilZ domain-containing protein [Holophagaceae bacterium]|nr:PilZ domain-containing protein [Holophagaceae bacterium]
MGIWPFGEEAPAGAVQGAALQAVLSELGDRKEYALLATPYLGVESRVLEVGAGTLKLLCPFPKDTAQRTLAGHPLRIRVPWKLTMLGGPVAWKAYGQEERRRWVQVERPAWLAPDELRAHTRCDQLGRTFFTLTTEDMLQFRGTVENLSLGGVLVLLKEPAPPGVLTAGRGVELSLRLDQGPALKTRARIQHGDYPRLGLAFQAPDAEFLGPLEDWLKPRLAEALRRWENRRELRAQAEAMARARIMAAQAEGILIIGSQLLAEEVAEGLEGAGPIKVGPAAIAPLKALLVRPPQAVILQVGKGDLEERYRLRGLWQTLGLDCPLVVLGTGQTGCAQEVALELHADSSLQWDPGKARFLGRLVLGLIKRGRGDDEESGSASR